MKFEFKKKIGASPLKGHACSECIVVIKSVDSSSSVIYANERPASTCLPGWKRTYCV